MRGDTRARSRCARPRATSRSRPTTPATWAESWAKIPMVRAHGAGRVDDTRDQGAHVVGQSSDPRGGAASPRRRWAAPSAITARVLHPIFILLPSREQRARELPRRQRVSAFHLAEGATPAHDLLGYLLLIGQVKDIKRVLHVPRRRAQSNRRVQERRRAHRRGSPELQHRRTCAAAPTSCSPSWSSPSSCTRSWVGPSLRCADPHLHHPAPLIAGLTLRGHPLRRGAHATGGWVQLAMKPGLALQKLTARSPPSTRSRSRWRRCEPSSPPSSWPRSTPGPRRPVIAPGRPVPRSRRSLPSSASRGLTGPHTPPQPSHGLTFS